MKKTYVMLGRTGDIMNILPAIQYEAQKNNYIPKLVVSQDYHDVLDGVSYVEKVVFPGDFRNILEALVFAKRHSPQDLIMNCSVYGKNYHYKKLCSSFQRESWRFTECPIAWGGLPLVFDKRDNSRELDLIGRWRLFPKHKLILVALSGTSSPLPHKEMLLDHLYKNLSDREYFVLDISELKAERIYDLLALYQRAHCLIAIDSAPLHLAQAMPGTPPELPIISLISDLKDTWHQSSWRRNHIKRILYSEVPNRLNEIVEAVRGGFTIRQADIHLVTTSASNEDAHRRNAVALRSWFNERQYSGTGRWNYHIYDSNGIPRVHDMIEYACARTLYDDDIIVVTNADINFVPGITGWILHEVERHGSAFFHRHDFQRIDEPYMISESEVAMGKWYPGSDTFAFTKKWWEKHRLIFPDMYFAREAWDMVMRNMIKRSGGKEIHNAIYHEKHPSFWEAAENKNCKENLHNRALAQQWLDTYGGDWNDWKNIKPYK